MQVEQRPSRRTRTADANVTHLECSLTGERYEAGQVHNLSRAGKPLLVRYDLDAAQRTLTRESLAAREPGMWKWRELLPHDGEPVSLGEPETPIVAACRILRGAATCWSRTRGGCRPARSRRAGWRWR